MALDTTISGSSSNSYISLEDANTYFAGHPDYSIWSGFSDTEKEHLLKVGTQYLQNWDYQGVVVDLEQALAFPRAGMFKQGDYRRPISPDTIPDEIKQAQCEASLHLFKMHDIDLYDTVAVAGLVINRSKNPKDLSLEVTRLLEPFLVTRSINNFRLMRNANDNVTNSRNTSCHIDVDVNYPLLPPVPLETIAFLRLTDTPDSYAGKSQYLVRVKNNETGLEFVASPSGDTVAWGGITGTLANQTDLSNALADKAPLSHAQDLNNPHEVTKAQLGLDNVDNTSDANKPISNAVQAELDVIDINLSGKAPISHLTNYNNPHQVTSTQILPAQNSNQGKFLTTDGSTVSWGVGMSGASGWSGHSGMSGYSGASGSDGLNGRSGYSGISGYSGYSGREGTSGFSGLIGYSGYSGLSGYSGASTSKIIYHLSPSPEIGGDSYTNPYIFGTNGEQILEASGTSYVVFPTGISGFTDITVTSTGGDCYLEVSAINSNSQRYSFGEPWPGGVGWIVFADSILTLDFISEDNWLIHYSAHYSAHQNMELLGGYTIKEGWQSRCTLSENEYYSLSTAPLLPVSPNTGTIPFYDADTGTWTFDNIFNTIQKNVPANSFPYTASTSSKTNIVVVNSSYQSDIVYCEEWNRGQSFIFLSVNSNGFTLQDSGSFLLNGTSDPILIPGYAFVEVTTIGNTNAITRCSDPSLIYGFSNPSFESIQFDLSPTITSAEGLLKWNSDDGTLEYGLPGGNVNLQIGQETLLKVTNKSGSNFTNGQVVYIDGAQGSRPTIALADANLESKSSKTIGILTEDINDNNSGYVCVYGLVRDVNTNGITAGSPVWLSGTAGAFTGTRPTTPDHAVFLGYCLFENSSSGVIFVHVQNGFEISELHDVLLGTTANGQLLVRDETSGYWKNTANILVDDANKKISSSTNDLHIDCGSQKTVVLDQVVWNDIIIYPTALGTGASAPDLVSILGSGSISAYGFDGATITEQLYGSFEMPHGYKEGTDLDIHVHWMPSTTGGGNVKWQFEYSIANMGSTFSAPSTTSSTNAAGTTAWNHIYSDINSAVSGSGLTIGSICTFRLFRNPTDGADTYAGDAILLSLGVHYQQDTIGSRQETSK